MMWSMLMSALFASSLIGSASATASIPSVGPVQNPGFEMVTPVGQSLAIPLHWVQSGSGSNSQPTVVSTNTPAEVHSGSYAAYFRPRSVTNIPNNPPYIAEIYQQIPIHEMGQILTLKWWALPGGVPRGVDGSPNGQYNFSVSYDHDEASSILLDIVQTPGSSTEASNWFWEYSASWQAPLAHGHDDAYITLTFSTWETGLTYFIDDITLEAPFIVGDPQFVGLRGQSFQVHGIDGAVYNLITSPSTQVNAQFKFLSQGKCPIFDGIPDTNCWAHPGSYLGSIGVQEVVNGEVHQVTLVAGSAEQGFASILVDDEAVEVGKTIEDTEAFSVTRISSHRVTVKTSQFLFTFDNSDMFINQAVAPRVAINKLSSHGLFGQTHQRKVYSTALKYIEGEVDDYMIDENTLFGKNFVYNQFHH